MFSLFWKCHPTVFWLLLFNWELSCVSYTDFFEGSESEIRSVVSDSLWPHGLFSPRNSPGQNTGVGSLSLLQGIFLTQGLNPGFPHCRQIHYQLSHQGSPRILAWVAYPFSRGSSQPRNQTRVSSIAGRFFTNWAIREAKCLTGGNQTSAEKMLKIVAEVPTAYFWISTVNTASLCIYTCFNQKSQGKLYKYLAELLSN